ncbi:response regulator [Belnapia sp. T18]|uniref:Response regulator n=1 Tax=Belnapia arida TaxID=2804533 RepID=A0ABS1U231_9PROT|nr:response regulator [Belnapia arida]MBL6078728.1 response regulator [Belnapia arida]
MTVLLVEDDAMVRLTLADFFEAVGLDFLEADNAEDALAIIADKAQTIDVLVTDLDLGLGDSGLILAKKARLLQPELRVVYETGSPELFLGHTFSERERVFHKPFDPIALAHAVLALQGGDRGAGWRQRPAGEKAVASSL